MAPEREPARRLHVLIWVVLIVLTVLVAQLANLQLVQPALFRVQAEANQQRSLPIYAPRGLIYDKNGEVLSANRAAFSVSIVYPAYNDPEVLQRLALLLDVPLADIERRVDQNKREWLFYEPVLIKSDITPVQHTRIREMQADLPGVIIETQPVREYRAGMLAAHVLGYVGEISESDLQARRAAGYRRGDVIGQYGLERYYESQLRGSDGVRWVEVDVMFRPLGEVAERRRSPVAGNSLVLTLDAELQRRTEELLDYTMWRLQHLEERGGPYTNARAGAVVVLDVDTAGVLAMASRPAFDLQVFSGGISAQDYAELVDNPWYPFFNRAVQGIYAPGSTFKMVTSAAALGEGVVHPDEQIFCSGAYDKVTPPKLDWTKYGHGYTNLAKAIAESCDIYYYEMGWRLGIDRLVEWTRHLGLGIPTGIDLPGEEAGILPDAEYRQQRAARDNPWHRGDDLSAAIGQASMTFTPLQLANYTATLASRGIRRQPHLVQQVLSPDGEVLAITEPVEVERLNLSEAHIDAIIQGMVRAHTHPMGTGTRFFGDFALPTAGKTGTSEVFGYDDYGVYVAFAPVDNPQLAVAIVVEQAGHGSSLAPIAKGVFAHWFDVPLAENDAAKIPPEWPHDLEALKARLGIHS